MTHFAFISRHTPTQEQHDLAAANGIILTQIGDADAFTVNNSFVHEAAARLDLNFEGVVVVHPAAALRLASEFAVGIFKNENRAPVGAKPEFHASEFHLFDLRD